MLAPNRILKAALLAIEHSCELLHRRFAHRRRGVSFPLIRVEFARLNHGRSRSAVNVCRKCHFGRGPEPIQLVDQFHAFDNQLNVCESQFPKLERTTSATDGVRVYVRERLRGRRFYVVSPSSFPPNDNASATICASSSGSFPQTSARNCCRSISGIVPTR